MTFNTIFTYIMLFRIDLEDDIRVSSRILGMAIRAELPGRGFGHINKRVLGVCIAGAVTGFTMKLGMQVALLAIHDILMAFGARLSPRIVNRFSSILRKGETSVVSILPKGVRDQKMPDQQKKPDEYGEVNQQALDLDWHICLYV